VGRIRRLLRRPRRAKRSAIKQSTTFSAAAQCWNAAVPLRGERCLRKTPLPLQIDVVGTSIQATWTDRRRTSMQRRRLSLKIKAASKTGGPSKYRVSSMTFHLHRDRAGRFREPARARSSNGFERSMKLRSSLNGACWPSMPSIATMQIETRSRRASCSIGSSHLELSRFDHRQKSSTAPSVGRLFIGSRLQDLQNSKNNVWRSLFDSIRGERSNAGEIAALNCAWVTQFACEGHKNAISVQKGLQKTLEMLGYAYNSARRASGDQFRAPFICAKRLICQHELAQIIGLIASQFRPPIRITGQVVENNLLRGAWGPEPPGFFCVPRMAPLQVSRGDRRQK
jgi:hypothetical protein